MILSAIGNDNGLDHIYFATGIINDPSGLKRSGGYASAMSRYVTLPHNRPERIKEFCAFPGTPGINLVCYQWIRKVSYHCEYTFTL